LGLALSGCPDFDRAFDDCVERGACRATAGQVYAVRALAVDDPRGATFEFEPAGRVCGEDCREYLRGSVVKVTARARPGFGLAGWSLPCEGADATCVLTVDGPAYALAQVLRYNIAFVTSSAVTLTSLGSLERASAFCQAHADDAGLTGPYVAWLSTSTHSAAERLASDGGWVTTRGDTVAVTRQALLSGSVDAPIAFDEHGKWQSTPVATGTDAKGAASVRSPSGGVIGAKLQTCGDLAQPSAHITVGHSTGGMLAWTDFELAPCASPYPLYCFGTSLGVAPKSPSLPPSALLAFVTKDVLRGDFGGLAAASAACQAEAQDAGLSGRTFVALLKSPGGENSVGGPDAGSWYRRDGVQVIDAAGPGHPVAPISLTARGTFITDDADPVWTGGPAGDCVGWSGVTSLGETIPVNLARADGLLLDPLPCSETAHLICLER
jgi:hypothetical protein